MGMRRRALIAGIIQHVLVVVLAAVFVLPLAWMIATALKDPGDVMEMPPALIPVPAVWQNFPNALTAVPFLQYLKNSGIYAAFSLVGDVLSSAMIAFAFARLHSRWSGPLFILVLATMMVP